MPIETLERPLAYECEAPPRSLVEHWWEHQLTDLAGKPTGPLHVKKGNSWVENMAQVMLTRLGNADRTGTNTGGVPVPMSVGLTPTRVWPLQLSPLPFGAGISNRGISPGRDPAPPAEATTDFTVATPITDGTGGSQLLFQDDVMQALVTITGGFRIFHEKLLLNQSGAAITITNVGLVMVSASTPSTQTFLFARDNITIVVPSSAGVIIKYREDWTV